MANMQQVPLTVAYQFAFFDKEQVAFTIIYKVKYVA